MISLASTYLKGITKWVDNKPIRTHCKASSVSVRLVFETRGKCRDFVARYRDDGIPMKLRPFCSKQQSRSANPNHLKTRRSESNLRLCGECNLELSFLMEMTKVHSSSQRSTLAHMSLSIKDCRNGIEKPVFKLAPLGSGQTFTLGTEKRRFPRITFCEGLIPDVEYSILGLANIEVTHNHTKGFRGSEANAEK